MGILSSLRYPQIITIRNAWQTEKVSKRSTVDLAYKVHGPSITEARKHMIVLHGFLGSKRNWASPCKKISETHQVCAIAADARNHGDSPHSSPHTYKELTSDVSQLITKLNLNKAHLMGHSMGGRTAMALALKEPSKVASLIVVDISPRSSIAFRSNFLKNLLESMRNVNFEGADDLSIARTKAKKAILASGVTDSIDTVAFAIMNVGQIDNKKFGWKCNLDILSEHYVDIAVFPPELTSKQYPGPTLFIGGGQSDFLPKSDETDIKKLFPQAQLQYIDHVGHNPHSEDLRTFLQIVDKFLSANL